jgi:quercetin dioxygenase-like cupin family protein
MPARTLAIASLALIVAAGVLLAQGPAITRSVVTRGDVKEPDHEAVLARVEIAAGGGPGWHTHPGDEIGYVTEGEVTLTIAGQPARKVGAGQGYVVPAGTVHNAHNDGTSALKLVTVYVVRKGQPLASPATAP